MGASVIYAGISFMVFLIVTVLGFVVMEEMLKVIQSTGSEQLQRSAERECVGPNYSIWTTGADGTRVEIPATARVVGGQVKLPNEVGYSNPTGLSITQPYGEYTYGSMMRIDLLTANIMDKTGGNDGRNNGGDGVLLTDVVALYTEKCRQALQWLLEWRQLDFSIRMVVPLVFGFIIAMVVLRLLMTATAMGRD